MRGGEARPPEGENFPDKVMGVEGMREKGGPTAAGPPLTAGPAAACSSGLPRKLRDLPPPSVLCFVQMQVSGLCLCPCPHPRSETLVMGPGVCTGADPANHREPLKPREPGRGTATAVCDPGGAELWQDGAGAPDAWPVPWALPPQLCRARGGPLVGQAW